MTSPEPAPPADPTSYRRRGFGAGFWAMMALCLLCVFGGIFIAHFVPSLFPAGGKATVSLPSLTWKTTEPTDTTAAETPPAPIAPPAPTAAPGADLAGLKSRVERLETGQTRAMQAASTALATAALMQAAQTSRPFAAELDQLDRVLPASPDVAALRDLAQTGAPTRAVLAADYSDAASAAIAAADRPADKASLMQRIRYAISSVITIRRVGDVHGKSADAVLARAEVMAEDGDLERALTELKALPPASNQAMSGWIGRAQRRVEIDRRLANIRIAAVRDLSTVTAGPS